MANMNRTFEWGDENSEAQYYGIYDKEDHYLDCQFGLESQEKEELKEFEGIPSAELPFIRTFPVSKIVLCMSSVVHSIHKGE
jgi:hypothetical protein